MKGKGRLFYDTSTLFKHTAVRCLTYGSAVFLVHGGGGGGGGVGSGFA